MIDTKVSWPNGAKCAVTLTFDFDAETLWLCRDPANAKKPGLLSQGTFGANVGVPSILQVLREMGRVPATFFVPGWTAERHRSCVDAIVNDGHEIGHHGYLHRWVPADDAAGEVEEIDRGLEALNKTVGVRPVGYRSPSGEVTPNLFKLLVERGFIYDTSMQDRVNPYFHSVGGNPHALVEIPWAWMLCDTVYALFSIQTPRTLQPNSHILEIWGDEFRAIYEAGGMFDLIMHPQVSGRPSRLQLLRRIIAHIQSFPDVWFCTCGDAARAFAEQKRAPIAAAL